MLSITISRGERWGTGATKRGAANVLEDVWGAGRRRRRRPVVKKRYVDSHRRPSYPRVSSTLRTLRTLGTLGTLGTLRNSHTISPAAPRAPDQAGSARTRSHRQRCRASDGISIPTTPSCRPRL